MIDVARAIADVENDERDEALRAEGDLEFRDNEEHSDDEG